MDKSIRNGCVVIVLGCAIWISTLVWLFTHHPLILLYAALVVVAFVSLCGLLHNVILILES